jgi:hypothetical protein
VIGNQLIRWSRRNTVKVPNRRRQQPEGIDLRLIDLNDVASRWLSEGERSLLQMFLAGQTPADLADQLGLTRACVWYWRRVLIRRLRSILND